MQIQEFRNILDGVLAVLARPPETIVVLEDKDNHDCVMVKIRSAEGSLLAERVVIQMVSGRYGRRDLKIYAEKIWRVDGGFESERCDDMHHGTPQGAVMYALGLVARIQGRDLAAAQTGERPVRVLPQHLTPTTDIYGQTLEVGCRVRSFDSADVMGSGKIVGMETRGDTCDRVAYVEGVLVQIGGFVQEGCDRYTIRVVRSVRTVIRGEEPEVEVFDDPLYKVYPPLNGTRKLGGGHCLGVVRILEESS